MPKQDDTTIRIDVGGIGRDMQGVIAGRDVKDVTVTIGGHPTPADKEPSMDEFKQLLAEIQQEIAEIAAQQLLLKEVDAAAPFTSQGAEQSVKTAAEKIEAEMNADEAEKIRKNLTTAQSLLSNILDGAKAAAEKTDDLAEAIKPLAQKLVPLVEKLGVAALWAGKLWLTG